MKVKVLLVDDDREFRLAISTYLHAGGFLVEATASNGAEALDILGEITVDIVLSDIRMPVMDGIALQRELASMPTPPTFVAITAFDTDEAMIRVLAEGAAGYVLKSSAPAVICEALRDALVGGTALSSACVTRLVERVLVNKKLRLPAGLDSTDRAILSALSEGLSNGQIARRLNYAQSTIKNRVSRLLRKFDVESRTALIVAWLSTTT